MTAPFFPAGAAEFPNDNPSLHDGARWVCPDTVGATRAIVRPRASGGVIPVVSAEPATLLERAASEPARRERRYDGPLGKSDRAFVFGAIALVLGCGARPARWLDVALAAMAVLATVTIVNRSRRALADEGRS